MRILRQQIPDGAPRRGAALGADREGCPREQTLEGAVRALDVIEWAELAAIAAGDPDRDGAEEALIRAVDTGARR